MEMVLRGLWRKIPLDLCSLRFTVIYGPGRETTFTVEEIVHMGAGDAGRAAAQRLVDAALGEVDLTPFAHRQLPTLSGGEQQRAHFARVLVQLACGDGTYQAYQRGTE